LFAGIVVAIVLLTAGAMYLVNRFTEPLPPVPSRGERAAAAVAAPEPGSTWSQSEPGDGGFQAGANPRRAIAPGPVAVEAAPTQAPAPAATPVEPAEEEVPSPRGPRRGGMTPNRPSRRPLDGPPRTDSAP
jgi:hypothetical protein